MHHAQTAKIEAGQVFLPERAAWLRDFQAEMKQFPNGRYDDQVDSVSQFLNWIENHRYRPTRFIHGPMKEKGIEPSYSAWKSPDFRIHPVPGAYSENGDNCQMQLRRRVRTH
jgi:hypothetical protein